MNKGIWILTAVLLVVSAGLLWLNAQSEVGLLNLFNEEKQPVSFAEPEIKAEETAAAPVEKQKKTEPPTVEKKSPFLVVIDPGHQAKANTEMEPIAPGSAEQKYKVTGGTTGVATKKPEYVLNLEASLMLKKKLEENGITVVLTRTSHNVNLSNRERAEIANEQKADLFVRLHADGSESSAVSGFSILVPGKDNVYTTPIFSQSEAAAQTILEKARQKVSIHDKGIFYRNDMTGFNWSKVPVILLEIGFMTNPEEDRLLSNPDYLNSVVEVTAQGIKEYAGQVDK